MQNCICTHEYSDRPVSVYVGAILSVYSFTLEEIIELVVVVVELVNADVTSKYLKGVAPMSRAHPPYQCPLKICVHAGGASRMFSSVPHL